MMECPRCGFVQPEDRYCANCGLDVPAAMAMPKPLLQRILMHPIFYVILAVTLVGGIVGYIRSTQFHKTNEVSSVPHVSESLPLTARNQNTNGNTSSRPVPRPQPEAETQTSPQTVPPSPQPVPTGSPAGEAGETADKTAPAPSELEITFAEVPRESLVQVLPESKIVAETATVRLLTLPGKERAQSLISAGRRLPGGRTSAAQPGSTVPFHFLPAQAADDTQGFFFDLSVLQSAATGLELELVGQVNVPMENPLQSRFDQSVTLPPGGAVVLIGFLPRRELPENLDTAYSNTPLNIMASPVFVANETEFILVVHGR